MITFMFINQVSPGIWDFSWAATTAPYRIYHLGVLLDTIDAASYTFSLPGYPTFPPPLEALDANDLTTPQNLQYPPVAHFQWRGVTGAESYVIEEYTGTSWTSQHRIYEDDSGWYSFVTEALDDVTEHQWRMKSVDRLGNESSPLSFTFLIVRNPPRPDVNIDYVESSGVLEVS